MGIVERRVMLDELLEKLWDEKQKHKDKTWKEFFKQRGEKYKSDRERGYHKFTWSNLKREWNRQWREKWEGLKSTVKKFLFIFIILFILFMIYPESQEWFK